MGGYTVIDVETTGLVPEKHDRVVEIGVVYVSHSGEVQGHWSTLVNPGRDVGPTWLHGVSATDVMKAPTFAEIAPHLLLRARAASAVQPVTARPIPAARTVEFGVHRALRRAQRAVEPEQAGASMRTILAQRPLSNARASVAI